MKRIRFSPFSFTEFYLLEAAELKVNGLPETERWRHSIRYYTDMLNSVKPQFDELFGRALRDYLWLASIGEARHAHRKSDYSIPEILRQGRSDAYLDGTKFSPDIEDNRKRLRSVFADYDWNSGGYGGDRWGTIVKAIDLYYTTPVGIFIDHCADLKHNGGLAFNKNPDFWKYDRGYSQAMPLLNLKRDTDDLLYEVDNVYSQSRLEKYMTNDIAEIISLAWARFECLPHSYSLRMLRSHRAYKIVLLPDYQDGRFSKPLSNWRCAMCDKPHTHGQVVSGGHKEICFDCADRCDHCGNPVHPNNYQYIDDLQQKLCKTCKSNFTNACRDCGTIHWKLDLNDKYICRSCWSTYEELSLIHISEPTRPY